MRGKHIIVGVSAGIAAYKAIEVVSQICEKLGQRSKVVMTKNATHIATPMTFGEISGHPVAVDMWEEVHRLECRTYCILQPGLDAICGCTSYS